MSTVVADGERASEPGAGPGSRARRFVAWVFAGDRRVWTVAAVVGGLLAAVILVWCLVPRPYFTGTDSTEDQTYIAPAAAHAPVCVPDLQIPAQTAGLRLGLVAPTQLRPALQLVLRVGAQTITSSLPPTPVNGPSVADFPIPRRPDAPAATGASLCLRAGGLVNWAGTPTTEGQDRPPTLNGAPLTGRIAIWYLPRAGAKRSYLAEVGTIFSRASLFRPGIVGAWTYWLLFFAVLPLLALFAVRCIALAAAGRARRLAAWVFAIAVINACCWALITPMFFAPDEVDHFAYTQSLVERGVGPDRNPGSALGRWSSAESIALEGENFFVDHQVGDGKLPWLASDEQLWQRRSSAQPPQNNGGGYETAAQHGPLYYLAVAPGYLLTRGGSTFSQLTLMRFCSALIGALAVLFTFLIGRELAPRRPVLAVLAALLVAFEPMYAFISGAVNNDVGVDAGAAILLYLLVRMLRRGVTLWTGIAAGVVLVGLPIVKGTAYSLWPLTAIVLVGVIWRHHRRVDLRGLAAFAAAALLVEQLSVHLSGVFHPAATGGGAGAGGSAAVGAVAQARAHPTAYLSYLWQVFLPRLSFMAPHFGTGSYPAFVIFDERGFAAFGWYDVLFPEWVYSVILVVMLATPVLALWAARREWTWVRSHWMECAVMILTPIIVIAGFEAAFYSPTPRALIGEFGRYAFPAIGPLAILVVGALHAFGRRRLVWVGTGLVTVMIAFGFASQLLELTHFYA